MQLLIVRIEEQTDGLAVTLDNLSREDATEKEKEFADYLEQFFRAMSEKVCIELKTIPGTRYEHTGDKDE